MSTNPATAQGARERLDEHGTAGLKLRLGAGQTRVHAALVPLMRLEQTVEQREAIAAGLSALKERYCWNEHYGVMYLPGESEKELTITLNPGATLKGYAVRSGGGPAPGGVHAVGAPMGAFVLFKGKNTPEWVRDGLFVLGGVPLGTSRLFIGPNDPERYDRETGVPLFTMTIPTVTSQGVQDVGTLTMPEVVAECVVRTDVEQSFVARDAGFADRVGSVTLIRRDGSFLWDRGVISRAECRDTLTEDADGTVTLLSRSSLEFRVPAGTYYVMPGRFRPVYDHFVALLDAAKLGLHPLLEGIPTISARPDQPAEVRLTAEDSDRALRVARAAAEKLKALKPPTP